MDNRKSVALIDYGMCNIYSVVHALEAVGAKVDIVESPEDILKSERIVLPGVGAFEDGMMGLAERQFVEPLKTYAASGKPLLGICLGMQMFMDSSEEFGLHQGLGLISGTVTAIQDTAIDGTPHKIPNIGWIELNRPEIANWSGTILDGVGELSCAYFVHSFTCVPDSESHRLADSYYNGRLVSAALRNRNVYGCQFHPEKSGEVGLHILRNFVHNIG